RISVSLSTRRNKCSFAGSPSSRPRCENPPRAVACTRSRPTPPTSRPSSTSSIETAPSSRPSPRASEARASTSSTRPGSCFATRWTAWDSALRRRCENARGTLGRDGFLEALLFFLDFLPRALLLFRAFLPPPTANWAPLAGLDLAARIHPEDEQDDDADHASVDRVGLPGRLTNVHGEGRSVLRRPPGARAGRMVDVRLDRLVPLTAQAVHGEHELHRVARRNRMVRRGIAVFVEPLNLS